MWGSASPLQRRFPTTHWSLVARAADLDPQVKREALDELLERYFPAFRAHLVLQKRLRPDEADDLLQSFACDRIVKDDLIARAEQGKGRLRNYLLKVLNRHVLMMRRHDRAQRRSPGTQMASIDEAEGLDSSDRDPGPSIAFDIAWARGVVAQAIESMRRHCAAATKQRIWRVFELRILAPILEGAEPVAYEQVARQCGFGSALEAANALVTAKRMFARTLRSTVEDYAAGKDVEIELCELRAILAT